MDAGPQRHQLGERFPTKAQLEEDAREGQLQAEREQREHQRRLEQAQIDRLLDEAALPRKATDIRSLR